MMYCLKLSLQNCLNILLILDDIQMIFIFILYLSCNFDLLVYTLYMYFDLLLKILSTNKGSSTMFNTTKPFQMQ